MTMYSSLGWGGGGRLHPCSEGGWIRPLLKGSPTPRGGGGGGGSVACGWVG